MLEVSERNRDYCDQEMDLKVVNGLTFIEVVHCQVYRYDRLTELGILSRV